MSIGSKLKFAGLSVVAITALLWGVDRFSDKTPEELKGASDPQQAAIDVIIKYIISDLAGIYKDNSKTVQRDAHAKAHGCLKATFKVADNLPENLKVGLFANAGSEHKAWVRFSNGAFTPRPDRSFDGRGLSLKILDAAPSTPANASQPVDQFDILMGNFNVFFSPNPVDYLDFVKSGFLVGKPGAVQKYFMPSYNPFSWRIRGFMSAYANSSLEIKSPLDMRYFSMSPYAFGANQQVKYSAQSCEIGAYAPKDDFDLDDPNYLRKNLKKHMDSAPACFALSVQLNDGSMPIDDASVEWSEKISPYQKVAYIQMPKQDFATPHNDNYCEHSDFNPGRTPKEFEALGSLNNLRKAVYTAISDYRHGRNAAIVPDPNLAWDQN